MSKKFIFPLVLIFLILIGITFYFLVIKEKKIKVEYEEVYRLVPEKVSQSAPIRIFLPPGVDKEYARQNIKFYPEIKGKWEDKLTLSNSKYEVLAFKPEKPLELNRYYKAELNLKDGTIWADFLVVENPKILAVFPKENSESPEDTEITIVFNRPMVPLTTLAESEARNLPIEIYPKTEGKFKWITTQNLQFIPKERLKRSSNYTLKIKPGFVSVEGLPVNGQEIHFTTRRLRYRSITSGNISFDQPIEIRFNQPVDLTRTKQEIKLIDNTTGISIPFVAQYPDEKKEKKDQGLGFFDFKSTFFQLAQTFSIFDWQNQNRPKEEERTSVILIYPKEDQFRRPKLWDFEKSYTLQIQRAYPLEGDIILEEKREVYVSVLPIIKELKVESQRSNVDDIDMFDPQGRVRVDFYEEIDLSKSKITADGLTKIEYGEKKSTIYLYFDPGKLNPGQEIEIKFEKLVNLEGLLIQQRPISRQVKVYPPLEVFKTYPFEGEQSASLTELIICSSTPLKARKIDEWKNYFFSNLDYEPNYWSSSWRVRRTKIWTKQECEDGQFKTVISYGLMPEENYSLKIILEDVFGQKKEIALNFKTQEMPEKYVDFYQLQRSFVVTTPTNTKLTFAAKNVEYANLRICKLTPENFLYYLTSSILPSSLPLSVSECVQNVNDVISLPKKYWIKNYFQVDIKKYFEDPRGHYLIFIWHPDFKYQSWEKGEAREIQDYLVTFLSVTNLAVSEKKIQPETEFWFGEEPLTNKELSQLKNLYWVTSLSNLEGVEGAQIQVFTKDNWYTKKYYTNKDGIALTDVLPKEIVGAVIKKGDESAVIVSSKSNLNWASYAYLSKRTYLYTDKPIYRPGEKVHIKGIYRVGYDGNWEIVQDKKVNLKIYNPKYEEVFSQDLDVSEFGTFYVDFSLDQNAPLGDWRACTVTNCVYFDVQEYVPSAFEVKVLTDKEEYISKDKVKIDIEANYYFGVPVSGGEVEYVISSQNYYFDKFKEEYYSFGKEWDYWSGYYYGERFLKRGKTKLSDDGKASIVEEFDIEELFKDEERQSKIIVIDVTVKDSQGRSVSSQKSYILHQGEFYIGIKPEKYFVEKNQPFQIKIKTTDTEGHSIPIQNLSFQLYKIDWVWEKRQEAGGGFEYRWEKKKEKLLEESFSTDNEGNYKKEMVLSKEGVYEILVEGNDKRNNKVRSSYTFYVFGEGLVSIPPTTDTKLEIETKKRDLLPEEIGEVIVKSPYSQAKALITLERGKIFHYEIVDIKGNLFKYQFRAKREYIPNVYLSVLLESTKPDVKFGTVEFNIAAKEKELEINVRPNKQFYLPGEEVILDIEARDFEQKPVEAELSIAVVDLSVLALKGNPKKDPVVFFYGGFPLGVLTSSNLKNILTEIKISSKGGAGYMFEAFDQEQLARKVRGEFRETAYFKADIKTDKNGKAQIRFTLPDNLTTWQVETIGVTKDTKLGVNYQEFVTKKDLMVIPLKPRFIIAGDDFYIGAKIFNQTEKEQNIEVEFLSPTLTLKENSNKKSLKISPKESGAVYFHVFAPYNYQEGEHEFTISAKGQGVEDTVLQKIRINPDQTYEVTATANYTQQNLIREFIYLPGNILKDKGKIKINTSATLSVFLSGGLNYLVEYPYGCAEQIASKLNAIAVLKKGLNLPNILDKFNLKKVKYQGREYDLDQLVEIGLLELYNKQRLDGGFGFWDYGDSNFYLTLHVIETLENLKLAGYNVNQSVIDRAKNFVLEKFKTERMPLMDNESLIYVAYVLYQNQDKIDDSTIKFYLENLARNKAYLLEEISSLSLAQLAILLNKGFDPTLKEQVFATLDNRIQIDSRGAFLEPRKEKIFYEIYENPIKDTAFYLKALSTNQRENPIIDKVIRWLLNSKSKEGWWGSTNNTVAVIDAFVEFLKWQREAESNFELKIFLNNQEKGQYHFEPQTILDQYKIEIPIDQLKFEKLNFLEFKKENFNQLKNNLYYDLSLKYYLKADSIPPRDEGFTIQRTIHTLEDKENKNPINKTKVGDVLRVHLKITVPQTRKDVLIEDFIPAGFEIVNLDLATEQKSLRLQEKEIEGRELFPDFKELRDDRAVLFKETLYPGVYEFDYFIRALSRGKFIHLPARVSEMYFPENFARTGSGYFEIE